MDSSAAEVISGRFRVEERLGKGGAATVFRVTEVATGKQLALKRLESGSNERVAALFELEYATLAGLRHPNIVEAFEYGADAQGAYYTMELLSGADLRDRAPLPWPLACRYAAEAAQALSTIHARKLIHRDVSPRNLWRTEADTLKLIDFGALAPFGTTGEVIGTPPCVAPEALQGNAIDQRADIYALGAVLYWLITGVHAYPARSLRELPSVWASPLVPASKRVAYLSRTDLPEVPPEFDALLESMLNPEPILRPRDTGDFLDRVAHFSASLPGQGSARAPRSLPQAAFVGRAAHFGEVRRRLDKLQLGRGGALLVTGRRGIGRSRLLTEAAIAARLGGATVLSVDAAGSSGENGVAAALAQRLLDALPETARGAAGELTSVLATLSGAVRERFRDAPVEDAQDSGDDARVRLLGALTTWFSQVSQRRPLVVAVDGLERCDDNSVWFLAGLAREARTTSLLVIVTALDDPTRTPSAAELAFGSAAKPVRLTPFGQQDSIALLGSMFGEVPNLKRLAERVQRATDGNPARMLGLASGLLERGVISDVDGTWVLHQELDAQVTELTATLSETQALERLSSEARTLARRLSVQAGSLSLPMMRALSLLDGPRLATRLSELIQKGVVTGSDEGYRFFDEGLREAAFAELTPEAKAQAHVRLGRLLLARGDLGLEEELEAHVHLLHGDDIAEAMAGVRRLARRLGMEEQPRIGANAQRLEEALQLCTQKGCDVHDTAPLLACLIVGGYYADRQLAVRYEQRALEEFDALFHAGLQKRLRGVLGRKLSLLAALVVSGVQFFVRRKRAGAMSFREGVALLFATLGSLSGVYTICIDADAVLALAERLEPWTALGKDHVASTMYQFSLNLAATVQDRPGEARQRWREMLTMLEQTSTHDTLPDVLRTRYLYGALYALGVLEAWRDSPEALRIAERLERSGLAVYRLSADQLRALYYANQGDVPRATKYMAQIEQHAIRLGNAWQVEVWAPPAQITYAIRAWDAMALKQSLSQVERLSQTIPSLKLWVSRTRGAHLVVRRRYEDAMPLLLECRKEKPRAAIGWGRSFGTLARAYNGLGEHARAKQVADEALAQLDPRDLEFPAMYLGLEIEAAIAELGLGEQELATQRIDALLSRHAQGGVLALGQLHDARVQVALAVDDLEAAEAHLAELERLYRSTAAPSLIARFDSVARQVKRAQRTESGEELSPLTALGETSYELSRIDSALTDSSTSVGLLATKALELLAQQVPANQGYLWLLHQDSVELAASLHDEKVPEPLDRWARVRIPACAESDATETMMDGAGGGGDDPNLFVDREGAYKLHVLSVSGSDGEAMVGAVAFPAPPDGAQFLDAQLARHVAACIGRARGA